MGARRGAGGRGRVAGIDAGRRQGAEKKKKQASSLKQQPAVQHSSITALSRPRTKVAACVLSPLAVLSPRGGSCRVARLVSVSLLWLSCPRPSRIWRTPARSSRLFSRPLAAAEPSAQPRAAVFLLLRFRPSLLFPLCLRRLVMPPLAYPLEDGTARIEQAFEVAYDSRWLGYTSSRGHRTISTAVWAWAKERYLDRISRRKWATLSTWTQMQCMAEWALLVDEVEKGKVRSPDDLVSPLPFCSRTDCFCLSYGSADACTYPIDAVEGANDLSRRHRDGCSFARPAETVPRGVQADAADLAA